VQAVLSSRARHLHDFAAEDRLTRAGQISDDIRAEFGLSWGVPGPSPLTT
jgi:hypothetical protein